VPLFVVHEHHSKTLHWDLRIEVDGVLKSWAVPKGPSMSPSDKRLAIMVEDHPLEYAPFEGIIPPGLYGAGPVVIWDSGACDVLDYDHDKGRAEFVVHGEKLKGTFVLTRLKGKEREWLLIKKKDLYALPSFTMVPALTRERLATLKEAVPPCDTD
jgi:bifunctional non-homologous end joining protein LigD